MIYLRANVPALLERIDNRARPAERQIPSGYLEQLNRRYEDWLRRFDVCPVLTIDTDELDLVNQQAHRQLVIDMVRQAVPTAGPLQQGLPGIDRAALIG
jgi:hypothetical protein